MAISRVIGRDNIEQFGHVCHMLWKTFSLHPMGRCLVSHVIMWSCSSHSFYTTCSETPHLRPTMQLVFLTRSVAALLNVAVTQVQLGRKYSSSTCVSLVSGMWWAEKFSNSKHARRPCHLMQRSNSMTQSEKMACAIHNWLLVTYFTGRLHCL